MELKSIAEPVFGSTIWTEIYGSDSFEVGTRLQNWRLQFFYTLFTQCFPLTTLQFLCGTQTNWLNWLIKGKYLILEDSDQAQEQRLSQDSPTFDWFSNEKY